MWGVGETGPGARRTGLFRREPRSCSGHSLSERLASSLPKEGGSERAWKGMCAGGGEPEGSCRDAETGLTSKHWGGAHARVGF